MQDHYITAEEKMIEQKKEDFVESSKTESIYYFLIKTFPFLSLSNFGMVAKTTYPLKSSGDSKDYPSFSTNSFK